MKIKLVGIFSLMFFLSVIRFISCENLWSKDMSIKLAVRVLSFFGPPGTGKGTIAQRCVKELGYIMLSTGDLARKHIQEQTDLGKAFAEFVNKGHLIPDDLITEMVLGWLKENMVPGKTLILDGFPRTKGQADFLVQALKTDNTLGGVRFKVVTFDLAEGEIVKRISARLVCSNKSCQEVYSTLVKQPEKTGICDLCDSPLIRRPDDEPAVVHERLKVFATFKDDLLGFYKDSEQEVLNFSVPEGDRDTVFELFKKLL